MALHPTWVEPHFEFNNAAVGTTVEVIGDDEGIVFTPGAMARVNVEVANASGSQTLNDFQVQFLEHPNGTWHTVLSGSDYATATATLLFCSTTVPNTLAADGETNFHIDVRAAHAVRFAASVASGTADVTVRGTVGFYGRPM